MSNGWSTDIKDSYPACSECGLKRNGAYFIGKPICFVCWPPENDYEEESQRLTDKEQEKNV